MMAPPQSPTLSGPSPMENPPARQRDWTWTGIILLILLLASGAHFLRKTDDAKPKDWLDDRLTYVPSGDFLKPMVLDFDEVAADLLWIRGMIYFSEAYLTAKSYRWMGHIIDVITTLNPRLQQAYEFSGVVLTKNKEEQEKTLRILDRGIANFPDDWKLRLYAAMTQLAFDSNYVRAAELLKPVAEQEDVPGHIKTMCAGLLHKGGNQTAALAFLIDRYLETKSNPIHRELFLDKILKLYPNPDGRSEAARKRVTTKVLREAEVEPAAKQLALEVLEEYLTEGPKSPKVKQLLRLIGE